MVPCIQKPAASADLHCRISRTRQQMMKKFGPKEISRQTIVQSSMQRAMRAQMNSEISYFFMCFLVWSLGFGV